jgi:hypothetical protein
LLFELSVKYPNSYWTPVLQNLRTKSKVKINRVPQFCTGDEIKKNMRRERRRRGTLWVSHLNWSSRSLTHSFGFAFPAPSLLLIGRYSSLNQVFLE